MKNYKEVSMTYIEGGKKGKLLNTKNKPKPICLIQRTKFKNNPVDLAIPAKITQEIHFITEDYSANSKQ